MNSKTNTVRAILLDASECDRPEADHPTTIEICADDLQRILERHITEPAQCLHQIAEPAENNLTRFCPECGHVGEVSNMHRDCCPDGSHAFMVPVKYAHELRDGFKALLHNAQRRGLATPNTLPQAITGGSEMQRAFEIELGQSWSDPNWRRETGIWASGHLHGAKPLTQSKPNMAVQHEQTSPRQRR